MYFCWYFLAQAFEPGQAVLHIQIVFINIQLAGKYWFLVDMILEEFIIEKDNNRFGP